MNTPKNPTRRTIRISSHTIQRIYGRDNLDDVGDDILGALQRSSEYPDQFRCRIIVDPTSADSGHHMMILEIEGISDLAHQRFLRDVADLGLLDVSDETDSLGNDRKNLPLAEEVGTDAPGERRSEASSPIRPVLTHASR